MRHLFHATTALACLAAAPAIAATVPQPVLAQHTAAFLNSIGVVVHEEYTDGNYDSSPQAVANVVNDLAYIGVNQVREGSPDPSGGIPYENYLQALNTLVNAGIKFDFLVGPNQPISTSLSQVDAATVSKPGSVIAIEGPNEVNNNPVTYNGVTDTPYTDNAARAFQKALYAAEKADEHLSGVPVYYFTGGEPVALPGGSSLADFANGHPYPYQGTSPGPRFNNEFETHFTNPLPYPRVATETGYFNQPNVSSGVDSSTQERLTLDLLMDGFQQGVSKTFLYQLLSAYPDPLGNNPDTEYGLFNQDNSPKPVATGIHNLTTILADTGLAATTFKPTSLAYSISSNLPATGNNVLLQRSDGSFLLVVWAEPLIWDDTKHTEIAAPCPFVTVTFRSPVTSATLYDPYKGTSAIRSSRNASSVSVGVQDHPVVYHIVM